jgi:hypothetical protein
VLAPARDRSKSAHALIAVRTGDDKYDLSGRKPLADLDPQAPAENLCLLGPKFARSISKLDEF